MKSPTEFDLNLATYCEELTLSHWFRTIQISFKSLIFLSHFVSDWEVEKVLRLEVVKIQPSSYHVGTYLYSDVLLK